MVLDSDCFEEFDAEFSDPDNTDLWELRQDDFLFGEGENPWWNMQLDMAHGGWHEHVWAYKTAADNLVTVLLCGGGGLKVFIDVYPVLALYRHYVEIAIKELIVCAANFNRDSVPKLETHALTNLWETAVSMLKSGQGDDPTIDWDLIGEYVAKVNEIPYDLGRYPWTRNREAVDLPNKYINLIQLRHFMNRLGNNLEGITNWLGILKEHDFE